MCKISYHINLSLMITILRLSLLHCIIIHYILKKSKSKKFWRLLSSDCNPIYPIFIWSSFSKYLEYHYCTILNRNFTSLITKGKEIKFTSKMKIFILNIKWHRLFCFGQSLSLLSAFTYALRILFQLVTKQWQKIGNMCL